MSTYELVERGAFIDKYIGDAVMAIFNVPLPAADHSARAVAALEIVERTSKLGERFGRTLAAGVGIGFASALSDQTTNGISRLSAKWSICRDD